MLFFQLYKIMVNKVYFITLLLQNNGRENGFISRMLFFQLYKIMVNKVTFVGFRGGDRSPLDLHPHGPLCCDNTIHNILYS